MQGHMAHLPLRKPELKRDGQAEGKKKKEGENVSEAEHGRRVGVGK
jgi:hypothetical protein